MKTKNIFYAAGGLFLIGILLVTLKPQADSCPPELKNLQVGIAIYSLECAITPAERSQGLSGRSGLPENTGMLFVFEKPAIYKFWMKDMKFPLDIIWLDESKRVVFIEKNVSPESYPNYFAPTDDSKYVLEINAGQSDKYGIKVGDIAVF